jgi:PAS domain S-box-containing protein
LDFAVTTEVKMKRTTPSQESVDYFKSLIRNSQVAITVVGNDGKLTVFSQGAEKLTGYSSKEAIGKPISMFYRDKSALQRIARTVAEKGKIENFETEILRKDRTAVPILISVSLLKDKDGNPSGSIGVTTDMTGIKKAYETLKRLEELHANTIANIDETILIMDTDLTILDANDAMAAVTEGRWNKQRLVGRNLRDVFPFVETQGLDAHYRKVMKTGKPVITVETVEFEGSKASYEARRFPVRDKAGKITMLIGVYKDITEARRIEEEILARNRELSIMNEVAGAVNRSLQLGDVLDAALDKSMEIVGKSQAGVFLYDEEENRLKLAASRNIPKSISKKESSFSPDDCLCGLAFREGSLLYIQNYAKDRRFRGSKKQSDTLIIVPIPHGKKMLGVMFFYPKKAPEAGQPELKLLTSICQHVGTAIENAYLYKRLEDSYLQTIKALALAVDAKDPYTRDHSEKVRKWAVATAQKLGLGDAEVRDINFASLLHDVGKLGTSDFVLKKPGELTEVEYEEVRQHPIAGSELLSGILILKEAKKIVLHHHEYFGGGGYPHGLKGKNIPLGARIIAIVDAFEAMTADRPYRKAMDTNTAKKRLRSLAGSQLDPELVELFLAVIEEEDAQNRD